MITKKTTKNDLIRENHLLRYRLQIAEAWMQREIRQSQFMIQKDTLTRKTRKHFASMFESENELFLSRKILERFGGELIHAPQYTFERLLDAEIYWYVLQQFPTLDTFPIIALYQKIFDAWVEDNLIAPWRRSEMPKNFLSKIPKTQKNQGIESDLERIITKKYQLSLGRLYQILLQIRRGDMSGIYGENFLDFLEKNQSPIFAKITADDFFHAFSVLIERDIFGKKRHSEKMNYRDAEIAREILIGKNGIFVMLFGE